MAMKQKGYEYMRVQPIPYLHHEKKDPDISTIEVHCSEERIFKEICKLLESSGWEMKGFCHPLYPGLIVYQRRKAE